MTPDHDGFGREHRYQPIRRLSRAECDTVEYEGPLVLCQQQMKWMIGPWRSINHLVVTHHTHGVMWEGSKAEWAALGLAVESEDDS